MREPYNSLLELGGAGHVGESAEARPSGAGQAQGLLSDLFEDMAPQMGRPGSGCRRGPPAARALGVSAPRAGWPAHTGCAPACGPVPEGRVLF